MDACGIERAHLIGNSMGGRVAFEVGFRNPARVGRIVGLAPSLAWLRGRPWTPLVKALRPELGLLQITPRPVIEEVVRRFVPGGRDGWSAVGVDEFLRAYLQPRGRAAFYAALRNIYLDEPEGDDGFWTRLRELQHESLFVWGQKGPARPDRLRPPRPGGAPGSPAPRARLRARAQLEAPRETHAAIRRFLRAGSPFSRQRRIEGRVPVGRAGQIRDGISPGRAPSWAGRRELCRSRRHNSRGRSPTGCVTEVMPVERSADPAPSTPQCAVRRARRTRLTRTTFRPSRNTIRAFSRTRFGPTRTSRANGRRRSRASRFLPRMKSTRRTCRVPAPISHTRARLRPRRRTCSRIRRSFECFPPEAGPAPGGGVLSRSADQAAERPHVGGAVGRQGHRRVVVVEPEPLAAEALVDRLPRVEVERRQVPGVGVRALRFLRVGVDEPVREPRSFGTTDGASLVALLP